MWLVIYPSCNTIIPKKTWTGSVGNKGTIKIPEAEWHQWLSKGNAITHSKVHDLQIHGSLGYPKKKALQLWLAGG